MFYSYDVAYSKFQQQKKERLAQWNKAFETQMKKVKSEKDWINKFKIGAQVYEYVDMNICVHANICRSIYNICVCILMYMYI